MNRAAVIIVALVVLAGSVPAAAALTDTQTESDAPAPGASLAGVVGVQQAEVDNEVAERALNQQFAAAESNDSKAQVVAEQSQQLSERLAALEAEKARVTEAYENGNMSRGEYKARLAALGAELRALEKRANRTADAAESLPEAALRNNGANVSEVRGLAKQANRTGGGEVAEAARAIGGQGVGKGLRGPPNASERGPPDEVGERPEGAGPEGTETNRSAGPDNGNGADGEDGERNRTPGPPGNETERGNGQSTPGQNDTETESPGNDPDSDETPRKEGETTESDTRDGQSENGTDGDETDGDGTDGDETDGDGTDGDETDGDDGTDGTQPTDDRTATA